MSQVTATTSETSWRLGTGTPRTHHPWLEKLGTWWMRVTGWRFEGEIPDLPRFVLIVAPHTSNWDFIVGLAAKWRLGINTKWWGKDTLFLPPLGWFMRAIGGIPVDRHRRHNVVKDTIAEFGRHEQFVLTIAPEGTRGPVDTWRSGFWHVARGADVPICCVALDWSRRVIRIGPTIRAEETDADSGIARVRTFYSDVSGRRHPDRCR